jgi:hypothetical protein
MEEFIQEHRRSGLSYEAELELLAEVYRLALESFRKETISSTNRTGALLSFRERRFSAARCIRAYAASFR